MRLFGWLRSGWCEECDVPFGEGDCDVCRINRGALTHDEEALEREWDE